MQSEKPCCATAAATMMMELVLSSGFHVGIAGLDDILKEVTDLKLVDDETIKMELLKRVRIYDYVASSAHNGYLGHCSRNTIATTRKMNNEINRIVRELGLEKAATECLPAVPLSTVPPDAGIDMRIGTMTYDAYRE